MNKPIDWCEECQTRHSKEFGEMFHGRILKDIPKTAYMQWLIANHLYVDTSVPWNELPNEIP